VANLFIIRDLSEKKGITLREIANRAKIKEGTIQQMIRSGSTNTATIEKIAEILEVPVGLFFDGNMKISHGIIKVESKTKEEEQQNYLIKEERLLSIIESQQRTIEALSKKIPIAETA